jgi:hypothetical protein
MSAQIPFSITFTPRGGSPIALVPADGWLARMPVFTAEQRVYEAAGAATAEEFFRALGGAVLTFDLAAETDESTSAAARNIHLDATMPTHGVITFAAAEWAAEIDAALHALDTDLPAGTGAATVVRTYKVTASAHVEITIIEAEEEEEE